MSQEIKVPAVGESIQEVIIGEWFVAEGTWVDADTPLVGLETDKATFDVPATTSGKITRIVKPAGEKVEIGAVIGFFEPSAKGEDSGSHKPATSTKSAQSESTSTSATVSTGHVMPAANRLLQEQGIPANQVKGSGPSGRVLKEDVIAHTSKPAASSAPAGGGLITNTGNQPLAVNQGKKVPITGIRKAIARRLVEAKQNAALLTTFNECDMTNVKDFRVKYQDFFVKKYGIKLGFMSFFVKAVVDALLRIPQIGAQIQDDYLVYPETYDIGVAVGGGKGLVVPILRSAERLSFAEIEQKISDFGNRASAGKILPQELEGGCFTISNGGVYGSLLSTPIVNPPQSGVLGMHNIVDRPVAVDGQVVIRPMMYLALTYDHRVVDGREAVTFLKRIREAIEDPMRMILEV